SAFRPAFQSGYGQVKQQSHTTVPTDPAVDPPVRCAQSCFLVRMWERENMDDFARKTMVEEGKCTMRSCSSGQQSGGREGQLSHHKYQEEDNNY
ncbi:hypothetical protein KUCAC02_002848, partial [Chaenocephalus aceratus]